MGRCFASNSRYFLVNGERCMVNATAEKPTQAALARALGVTAPAIVKWKRAGMPTDSIEAAQAWRAARVRPRVKSKPAPVADDDCTTYHGWRTRRERAQALQAERELRVRGGELVEVEAVIAILARRFGVARDRLLGIPSRVAPQVAGLGVHEAGALLEAEILAALEEISAASDDVRRAGEAPKP